MMYKLQTTHNKLWVYRTMVGAHKFSENESQGDIFTSEEADWLVDSYARRYTDRLIKVEVPGEQS